MALKTRKELFVLKAALINIFILRVDQMTLCDVKGVAPHRIATQLQFSSALWCVSASFNHDWAAWTKNMEAPLYWQDVTYHISALFRKNASGTRQMPNVDTGKADHSLTCSLFYTSFFCQQYSNMLSVHSAAFGNHTAGTHVPVH